MYLTALTFFAFGPLLVDPACFLGLFFPCFSAYNEQIRLQILNLQAWWFTVTRRRSALEMMMTRGKVQRFDIALACESLNKARA